MTTENEPTNLTPEKLDKQDPAERTDTDALNLDTPTLDALNLDLPSAEFERQLIARLPARHRDFAKEVFRSGREVLIEWTIERARRRRGRGQAPNA